MRDQPRIEPLEAAPFFADGVGARHVPLGVVPRGQAGLDRHLSEGRLPDGSVAETYPFAITAADLERGNVLFDIHCLPCHGRLGDGDGIAAQRGYPAPPRYSDPEMLGEPPGEIFEVIGHGHAFMPDYDHIAVDDRWRIAAWVEVLQFSQHAPASMLAPEDQARLAEAPQ